MASNIKLFVMPLFIRVLIPEMRDEDQRFTGAQMEQFCEMKAAWRKRALSMAVYHKPSKNLFLLHSSLQSTGCVGPLKVRQCIWLSLGLRCVQLSLSHCYLLPPQLF
jgi:hypothetical protein